MSRYTHINSPLRISMTPAMLQKPFIARKRRSPGRMYCHRSILGGAHDIPAIAAGPVPMSSRQYSGGVDLAVGPEGAPCRLQRFAVRNIDTS